ncbi:MAG: transcriptional regulator [Caldisphaera sp.]|uniref:transcriptional regulator n=1 Tax=Caldisphaera sp. TaxID=2060322 RepID=UPI000CC89736|nr:MAG: transcriptional regulator [Caldisphaera sp.]
MNKDKATGALLMVVSIVTILAYLIILWYPPIAAKASLILLKLTGSIAVLAVFAIIGWIGYTLATTPPPKPIEEIEKELEKELKEITKESKGEDQKQESQKDIQK